MCQSPTTPFVDLDAPSGHLESKEAIVTPKEDGPLIFASAGENGSGRIKYRQSQNAFIQIKFFKIQHLKESIGGTYLNNPYC